MDVIEFDVEAAKRMIRDMDLSFVQGRLRRYGYTAERAERAVALYKNFLQLRVLHPDQVIVPPRAADHAWHEHILHTERYARDMNALFGSFLHHDPEGAGTAEYERACDFTRTKFQELFGIALPAAGAANANPEITAEHCYAPGQEMTAEHCYAPGQEMKAEHCYAPGQEMKAEHCYAPGQDLKPEHCYAPGQDLKPEHCYAPVADKKTLAA